MSAQQSTNAVLMITPASYGFEEETAHSNTFQKRLPLQAGEVTELAMAEFQTAVATLRSAGIDVVVHHSDPNVYRPSEVFPNNWISTWPNDGGRIYMYPMSTSTRRPERDPAVIEQLSQSYQVSEVIDLSGVELQHRYLESTGAIVFDHVQRIAYGCISERCDPGLFRAHAQTLGYTPIAFHAYDAEGAPIYHTNVMMGIQSTTAVVCLDSITDPTERQMVEDSLSRHHQIIDTTPLQVSSFCGNVLELVNSDGTKYLALSQTAYDAFTPEQRATLSRDKTLLPIAIPTLEAESGGSLRCTLAEIFLPPVGDHSAVTS